MSPSERVTRLELTVLLSLFRLDDEAYGMRILEDIRRHGEKVLRPSVYETLRRLESKGLVSSRMGDPLPERGGRARRYYRLEPSGLEAIRAARDAWDRIWGDAERLLEQA